MEFTILEKLFDGGTAVIGKSSPRSCVTHHGQVSEGSVQDLTTLYDEVLLKVQAINDVWHFSLTERGEQAARDSFHLKLAELAKEYRIAHKNQMIAGDERNFANYEKYENEARDALTRLREFPFEVLVRLTEVG